MKITLTKANVPACCANCAFNDWQEDGPHCSHPAHWEDDDFELDEDGQVVFYGEPESDGGFVDWDDVCENHRPGRHALLPEATMKALIDQRHAEAERALKATQAA